ncbi:hypothetical protein BVRB_9g210370 [Beta vulgaris subsp. vulgaris]|nr:hypothetical protein BVRB_9g210370 [Beta vulgaris subsp. vulgaris]
MGGWRRGAEGMRDFAEGWLEHGEGWQGRGFGCREFYKREEGWLGQGMGGGGRIGWGRGLVAGPGGGLAGEGMVGGWTNNGRPVSFYPSYSSQKQIIQGDEMNIAFSIIPLFRDTSFWRLTFDNETHIPYVVTNGIIGNPGTFEKFGNWFKIEKSIRRLLLQYRVLFHRTCSGSK